MATETAFYTKAQREKAERLAQLVPTLPTARSKESGITYVIVPSSDDPEHTGHLTNGLSCSCEGFKRRSACSHALAVFLSHRDATMRRIEAAQANRRQFGVCQQPGCIFAATSKLGRCEAHTRTVLALVADLSETDQ